MKEILLITQIKAGFDLQDADSKQSKYVRCNPEFPKFDLSDDENQILKP